MKNKYLNLSKIITLALSISAIVFGCCIGVNQRKSYNNNPKYIMSSSRTIEPNSGDYDYYLISEDTQNPSNVGKYAVALKSTSKNKSSVGAFPTGYPNASDNNVVGIWRGGFANSAITSINLRDTYLNTIDFEAFMGCASLTSITIPYTVSHIGEAAFYNCTGLLTARIDNDSSAAQNISSSACECIEPGQEAEGDGEDYVESSLTTIPAFCFYNCYSMTDILFNKNITTIDYEAFNGCSSLKSTLAFQSIRFIRARAFQGCKKLSKIYIPNSFFTYIPNDPEEERNVIEPYAFLNCADPGELEINFSGTDAQIRTWINNPNDDAYYDEDNPVNTSWGANNELDATSAYAYNRVDAGSNLSGDWEYTYKPSGEYLDNEHTKPIYDVTITKYTGPTKIGNNWVHYISIPDNLPIGNSAYRVREIARDVFTNDLKAQLERLYLPRTLRIIEELMFDASYTKLEVIDSNIGCQEDKNKEDAKPSQKSSIRKRIQLNKITDLEVIKDFAFINLPKGQTSIEELYLPYSLKIVGNAVFGSLKKYDVTVIEFNVSKKITVQQQHMKKIKKFVWEYDDEKSQLEAIGHDAFYRLGADDDGLDVKKDTNVKPHPMIMNINSTVKKQHETSTLILPKTFRHTGFTNKEASDYGVRSRAQNNNLKGEHVFAGCPLIDTVIIKGSSSEALSTYSADNSKYDSSTYDMVLGMQFLAYNECLRTVIIEERAGRKILFHTQHGKWFEPCIGWNSGRLQNDFSSDPFLQTIILPNQYTYLVMQEYAIQANSRASLYFTGTMPGKNYTVGDRIFANTSIENLDNSAYGSKNDDYTPSNTNNILDLENLANAKKITSLSKWIHIGDEITTVPSKDGDLSNSFYSGYYFKYESANNNPKTITNGFGINQQLPYYENVHYEEIVPTTVTKADGTSENKNVSISVGVNSTKDLIFEKETVTDVYSANYGTAIGNDTKSVEKYAYVCDSGSGDGKKATFSKYLYDRYNKYATTAGKAHIASTVTNYAGASCEVNAIGGSAFSATFTDTSIHSSVFNLSDANYKELTTIEVPDTIASIGDYAFFRAYGVAKLTAYKVTDDEHNGELHSDYTMPSSLTSIGKHAFAFCNIVKFLEIPDACVFYESTNAAKTDYYATSVFMNNLSLRKITFAPHQIEDNNNPGTYIDDPADTDKYTSSHYKTTYYTLNSADADGDTTYTTAVYDTVTISAQSQRRLLVVLNRDNANIIKTSEDVDTQIINSITINKFNGSYGEAPFLYGAYKMGADWIQSMSLGNPSRGADNAILMQPFFSRLKNCYLYLCTENNDYRYSGKSVIEAVTLDAASELTVQERAFDGCTNLERAVLPRNETGGSVSIPSGLFANTNISIFTTPQPDTPSGYKLVDCDNGVLDLTYTNYDGISSNAFNGVNTINEIIAPQKTNFTIDERAFKDCTGLHVLDFSKVSGTLTINSNAFEGCTDLQEIKFKSDLTVSIGSSAFKNAVINGTYNSVFTWPTTGSVSFGSNAFEGCKFADDTFCFPTSTTSIGGSCFKNCNANIGKTSHGALKTVTADGVLSLTSIGNNTFENCTGLTSFDFNYFNKLTSVSQGCFKGCTNLASITSTNANPLPDMTSFGNEAFANSGLTTLDLTKFSNVTSFGNSCFSGCTSLASVDSDNASIAVTNIGSSAFSGCTSLTGFNFDKFTSLAAIGDSAFASAAKLTSTGTINLPASLTSIGSNAFQGSAIENVNINSSTLTIGQEAFKGCSSLETLFFTDDDCKLTLSSTYGQFDNCTSLQELWLPYYSADYFNINSSVSASIVNNCSVPVIIYTYQTYPSSSTTNWRIYNSSTNPKKYAYIAFQISSSSTLIDGEPGSYTKNGSITNEDYFWIKDGGNIVKLGYVTNVSSAGVVTFSSGRQVSTSGLIPLS